MLCVMSTQHVGHGQPAKHFVNILENKEAATSSIKIPIDELFVFYNEKKDLRLYKYFEALINLMASICMERNYKCIK